MKNKERTDFEYQITYFRVKDYEIVKAKRKLS